MLRIVNIDSRLYQDIPQKDLLDMISEKVEPIEIVVNKSNIEIHLSAEDDSELFYAGIIFNHGIAELRGFNK